MKRTLLLILIAVLIPTFGATRKVPSISADEVTFSNGTTVGNLLVNTIELYDADGDGSVYETCTGDGAPAPQCKVAGEIVYEDFVDDVNAILLTYADSDVTIKLRPGVIYTGCGCWQPGGVNDCSDPTTHDSSTVDTTAYGYCQNDEFGNPLWTIAVRGRKLTLEGGGTDTRRNDTSALGGTARPTGRTIGTTISVDNGNMYDDWFTIGTSQNAYISVGVPQPTRDTTGVSYTGAVAAADGNAKGWGSITVDETHATQVHRGSLCVCNDATAAACIGATVDASATGWAQTLAAGDRIYAVIPQSEVAANTKPVGMTLQVAGVASGDRGVCPANSREIYLGTSISGLTFIPTGYEAGAGGLVRVIHAGADAVSDGEWVTISGTTGGLYDGNWETNYVDATHLDLLLDDGGTPSSFSVNPAAPGSIDVPRGIYGVAYGDPDDNDGTGPALVMHPDESFWDGSLTVKNLTIEAQDYWTESGGDCTANSGASQAGIWHFGDGAGDPDNDNDCDTNPFFIAYSGKALFENVVFKNWHSYMLDGGAFTAVGPIVFNDVKAMYGHGEAVFDSGQNWRFNNFFLSDSRFAGGSAAFVFFTGFTSITRGEVSNVEAGSLFSLSSTKGVLIDDLHVYSSEIGNVIYVPCGARNNRVRNIYVSGIDSYGHGKDGSGVPENSTLKIECTDASDPTVGNEFTNIYDTDPAHPLSDATWTKTVQFLDGSDAGVFGNTFAFIRNRSASSDSCTFAFESDAGSPTASEIDTLQILEQNSFFGNYAENGSVVGWFNKNNGVCKQVLLTIPFVESGAGNISVADYSREDVARAAPEELIFCGQLVDAGSVQTWIGPAVGDYYHDGTDYSIGSAACDALDAEDAEATADAPIDATFPPFRVNGFRCQISGDPANNVTFTMHSAAAAMTPSPTCTIAGTGSAQACSVKTTSAVAAGATVSFQVDYSEDLDLVDAWCKVNITMLHD